MCICCTITFKNRSFQSSFQQNTPVYPCNLVMVRGKSMGESLIAEVNCNICLLVFGCFAQCTEVLIYLYIYVTLP